MTTPEVLDAVRVAIKLHKGDEQELLEALCDLSEGWHCRLDELDEDQDDEDDVEDMEIDEADLDEDA